MPEPKQRLSGGIKRISRKPVQAVVARSCNSAIPRATGCKTATVHEFAAVTYGDGLDTWRDFLKSTAFPGYRGAILTNSNVAGAISDSSDKVKIKTRWRVAGG